MVVLATKRTLDASSFAILVSAILFAGICGYYFLQNSDPKGLSPAVDSASIRGKVVSYSTEHSFLWLRLNDQSQFEIITHLRDTGRERDINFFIRAGDSVFKKPFGDSILVVRDRVTFAWALER